MLELHTSLPCLSYHLILQITIGAIVCLASYKMNSITQKEKIYIFFFGENTQKYGKFKAFISYVGVKLFHIYSTILTKSILKCTSIRSDQK